MIECSDKNIWYIKRRRHKKGAKRLFSCVFAVILTIFCVFYYKTAITKQIIKICSDTAYSYSAKATNDAVILSLANTVQYEDLISIQKNSNGDVVYMSANSYKINQISTSVANSCFKFLDKNLKNGVEIPILAFTGIDLISGYGKIINYKAVSVSAVKCDFSSEFISAGVNQTKHTVYLTTKTEIFIDLPLSDTVKIFENKILIGESVIVGKVPDIYLNGKLFT